MVTNVFCFIRRKFRKFSQKLRIYYIFYKNNVNWSRAFVVLKFSFVLNNRPLFSTLIFRLVFFYKIVLIKKSGSYQKSQLFNFGFTSGVRNSEIERRLEILVSEFFAWFFSLFIENGYSPVS